MKRASEEAGKAANQMAADSAGAARRPTAEIPRAALRDVRIVDDDLGVEIHSATDPGGP